MPVPSDNLRFLRKLPKVRFDEEPRGYSKAQVDRVLENIAPIADSIEDLQLRLSEAEGRAAVAESRLVDTEAKLEQANVAGAAAAEAASTAAAKAPVEEASSFGSAPLSQTAESAVDADFDQTLRNTLLTAQRTADSTVREANDEAERMRTDARDEATSVLETARADAGGLVEAARAERDSIAETIQAERQRLLSEVDREADQRRNTIEETLVAGEGAERGRLLQEVTDLQQIRGLLADDIEVFESHLADRRAAVGDALAQLSSLVDQADGFAEVEAPQASEHVDVDTGQYEEVSIGLPDDVEDALERDDEQSDSTAEGFLFGEAPAPVEAPSSNDESSPFTDGETQMFEVVLTDDEPEEPVDAGAVDESTFGAFEGADDFDGFADVGTPEAPEAAPAEPEGAIRPAWADAIPPETPESLAEAHGEQASGASDPFLDELRRATGDDGESNEVEDEALSRFLDSDDEDTGRSGWFSRRK